MQLTKSKNLFTEAPMDSAKKDRQTEWKYAQHHVFSELLKRGVLPHRAADGSLRANTPMGRRLDLPIAVSTGNAAEGKQRFSVPDFRPRPELIFLCAEINGGEIEAVWVIPATVFFVYSNAHEAGRPAGAESGRETGALPGAPFPGIQFLFPQPMGAGGEV